ncbi:flagellar assembly protein FliW [Paeniglutamicibacter cryotolerans]|uniref:Flagellar assembly factor FliW n=1 Tax=Paeniglutamicibacter cryotolerans TaxID=670079 RepID=A0A839QDD7_9MICC|nr:flagellar assembly protein FliW [Paeniglutamicibacter cryotolerans]MBB2993910.1 flagellar assembly factor FliW [Paeniglutamicibacter cryotolerans]
MSLLLVPAIPFPGFESSAGFRLEDVEGTMGLHSLESVQDPALRLFVLDAALHLPHYTPVFTDGQRDLAGITEPDQQRVLVVVNTSDSNPTVNLLAPILVNASTLACAQVILEGQSWDLRTPLPA